MKDRGEFNLKILIIYASKTGTTEKCAKNLGTKMENAKVINIYNQTENIDNYDLIVIGSPIRMGIIYKK